MKGQYKLRSKCILRLKLPVMQKVVLNSHSKHMLLPTERHELIRTIYKSDLKHKELEEPFHNNNDGKNQFLLRLNLKSLINVLENKVYLVDSPIPQKNPVQQTYVERTKQNTGYVHRYRIPI